MQSPPDPDSTPPSAPQSPKPGTDLSVGTVRVEVGVSAYSSMVRAGVPAAVAVEALRLLGSELDLTRDLDADDWLGLVFTNTDPSGPGGRLLGELLMVEVQRHGTRQIRFYRSPGRQDPVFVDAAGQPAARQFLRTPVDGAQISSAFGPRLHPVLGYSRQHQGLDYAAPQGTPVLAAADGVIAFIGKDGAYGEVIRLSHSGQLSSLYAHLSAHEPGLAPGMNVTQGQQLGRVGQSGLATGPHLHFEIRRSGQPLDPAGIGLARPVVPDPAELASLERRRAILDPLLAAADLHPALKRLEGADLPTS